MIFYFPTYFLRVLYIVQERGVGVIMGSVDLLAG